MLSDSVFGLRRVRRVECLATTTKLIAPFVPFLAETLWQNLARNADFGTENRNPKSEIQIPQLESVHLCDYPTPEPAAIDVDLSERMDLVRLIASLGRNARNAAAGAAIGNAIDDDGGAAAGAAAGVGASVVREGESVTVPQGAILEFRLTQAFQTTGR